ncbi:pantoate--beta-alanine ligase [uncultured Victivallis sp.]|uniref:pantoate--beta-alanine ligase n=1 Tax=Victivallis sp. TaxID=2049020 RepID=UPI0025E5AE5A|nr:pantoate--beta-alanine ligase [uncultured Victivallis sp.]
MRIFRQAQELQQFALETRRAGKSIALVPTMGFLHAGHASLIDIARGRADVVIVSIFVNPTQFGPGEDLDKYPRDFEHDRLVCEEHGADVIFAPEPGAMYAPDASTWVEETVLSRPLCGARRPGHFRGVATVVTKLFHLALPDVAVFGRKDAQQLLVIKRMVRDLNFPIEIVAAPLVRGADGLALSSRNRYLSEEEHQRALVLSRSLRAAKPALEEAGISAAPAIIAAIRHEIEAAGGRVDYVEALDVDTLAEPTETTREVLLALAAYFGSTRLIDNELVQVKK